MEFTLPEVENWQLYNLLNFPKESNVLLTERQACSEIVIFMPFCLFRHYGAKSTSMWEQLKQDNFLPFIKWLKHRIDIYRNFTGAALSLSTSILNFKVVYLIDPIEESREIKEWLTNELQKVSKSLAIQCDFLEVSLRDEPDSTRSYRNILAPACARYLLSEHACKDFFIIIRLDSDDLLLPFYFKTIKTLLSLPPIYSVKYPYTLIPTSQKKQTIYTKISPFQRPTLLEFPLGVQSSLINNVQKITLWGENNFSSVWVSKSDIHKSGITHFSFPHDRIPSFLNRTQICTLKPAWVQLLHSQNEQNSFLPWGKDFKWTSEDVQISNILNQSNS